MGCGNSTMLPMIDEQAQSCIDLLTKKPDLKVYKANATNVKLGEQMYKNEIYGNTVFHPVGRMKDGKIVGKRDIKNPLEEDIKKQPISILYGGGFYVLKHVKYAANVFIDVWLLVESIDDHNLI